MIPRRGLSLLLATLVAAISIELIHLAARSQRDPYPVPNAASLTNLATLRAVADKQRAMNALNSISDRDGRLAIDEAFVERYSRSFNPVIFVPGDGGSQLEAKLNKTTRVHYVCSLVSDWFDLWLNIHLLAPYAFDCLCDNMRLTYNRTSRTTYNTEGVQIRAPNFGSLDSVAYLDIMHISKTDYFEGIIATLEKKNLLKRNLDMRAAPFDFRKAPNELPDFFKNLSELIEDQYVASGYRPVTLICHSMGCLNSLYLLNSKTDVWKEVHIKRLITLGSPWDGSFKAINAMLFGDNLGIPLLNQEKLQALQSTFPSLMYLFPKESKSFPPERVLVQSPTKNYSLENLDELFDRSNLTDQKEMWHDTKEIALALKAPNVELWCLHGSGVDTPSKIVYDKEFDTGKYHIEQGDGDGTVNLESLKACQWFTEHQEMPVYMKDFPGLDHIQILRSQEPADYIATQILINDQFDDN